MNGRGSSALDRLISRAHFSRASKSLEPQNFDIESVRGEALKSDICLYSCMNDGAY